MSKPKVLIAGRIDVDSVINVHRHPEPGEEIGGWNQRYLPGGKGANQAIAASRAGADVFLYGCVGDDSFGDGLLSFLATEGIDLSHVKRLSGSKTGMAFVVVDEDGRNTIVYDATDVPPVVFDTTVDVTTADVLVSQFDIPHDTIVALFRSGRRCGAINLFNAAPAQRIDPELLELVDVLVLNEFELAYVASSGGLDPSSRDDVEAALERFVRPDKQALVVTLGAYGAAAAIDGDVRWVSPRAVRSVDTTGAGDAFTGALAAELTRGVALEAAVRYACASATLSVTRHGASTSMPHRGEVEEAGY